MSSEEEKAKQLVEEKRRIAEDDSEDDEEEDEDYNPANNSGDDTENEDDTVPEDTSGLGGAGDEEKCQDSGKIKIIPEKVDSIWEEFQKSISSSDKSTPSTNEPKKQIVTKEYDFAGDTVVIQEEVNVDQLKTKSVSSHSNSSTIEEEPTRPSVKRPSGGGLASVLSQLKKPKMSTLTKSLHDWNQFKKSTKIEDELESHRRSKGSFIERQAFLSRTDLREFEREKSIREHERKLRDMKNNK